MSPGVGRRAPACTLGRDRRPFDDRRPIGRTSPERQVDGERAAFAGRARDGDLAAEEADELAADRQAEAGAAVDAGRRAVALGERFEDPLLLLLVDADAGVDDGDGEHRRRAVERLAVGLQPSSATRDLEPHLADGGELEGVGEQVLEDLAEALRIGDDVPRAAGGDVDRVADLVALGHVLELADEGVRENPPGPPRSSRRRRCRTRPWPGRGCC